MRTNATMSEMDYACLTPKPQVSLDILSSFLGQVAHNLERAISVPYTLIYVNTRDVSQDNAREDSSRFCITVCMEPVHDAESYGKRAATAAVVAAINKVGSMQSFGLGKFVVYRGGGVHFELLPGRSYRLVRCGLDSALVYNDDWRELVEILSH